MVSFDYLVCTGLLLATLAFFHSISPGLSLPTLGPIYVGSLLYFIAKLVPKRYLATTLAVLLVIVNLLSLKFFFRSYSVWSRFGFEDVTSFRHQVSTFAGLGSVGNPIGIMLVAPFTIFLLSDWKSLTLNEQRAIVWISAVDGLVLLLTFSRSVYLAVIAGTIVASLGLWRGHTVSRPVLYEGVLAVVAVLVFLLASGLYKPAVTVASMNHTASQRGSTSGRLAIYRRDIALCRYAGILGNGPGSFPVLTRAHPVQALNSAFQLVIEFGWVTGGLALIAVVLFLTHLSRRFKSYPHHAYAALAVIVAVSVHNLFWSDLLVNAPSLYALATLLGSETTLCDAPPLL